MSSCKGAKVWTCYLLWWMISISITAAQRVDYCFSEGHNPCDSYEREEDMLDLSDPKVFEKKEEVCHSIVEEYADGVYWDQGIWAELFAEIPSNSELCDDLRLYFPYCWYCIEAPCKFMPGEERAPTCDATEVNLPSDYEPFFDEDIHKSDQLACAAMNEWLSFTVEVDNMTAHGAFWEEFDLWGTEEECNNFYQAHPNCYWCAPGIDVDNNYCSFEALCDSAQEIALPSDADLNTAELEATCQEIEWIIQKSHQQIYTVDVCEKAPLALATTCPQFCNPCFAEASPPSCEAPSVEEMNAFEELIPGLVEQGDDWWDNPVLVCDHLAHIIHSETNGDWAGTTMYDTSLHLKALSGFRADSPICPVYQHYYHQCFWCAAEEIKNTDWNCLFEDVCRDEDAEEEEIFVEVFEGSPEEVEEFEAACEELRGLPEIDSTASTIDLCQKAQKYERYCSCWEPETEIAYDYLGADTTSKKRTLVWMPRVAAILSFFGASYILRDVLLNSDKRGIVYFQLMVCMAIFDLCTAFAWVFSTAPIPNYNIEGARGTDATCTAQGFFIQLGFTSVFFNVALAAYYWLVIVKNYKEFKLQQIRAFLFLPPIFVGFGLAFGGIPIYQGYDYGCHIVPVPHGELWQVLLFAVIPIAASILIITSAMIKVYRAVRAQSLASRRWSMRFGESARLERQVSARKRSLNFAQPTRVEQQVFWQAFLYTMSFYITWPIVLCVYVTGWDFEKHNFSFSVLVAFVAPLQGFNNALVFVFPKLKLAFRKCCLGCVNPTDSPTDEKEPPQETPVDSPTQSHTMDPTLDNGASTVLDWSERTTARPIQEPFPEFVSEPIPEPVPEPIPEFMTEFIPEGIQQPITPALDEGEVIVRAQ